MRGERRSTGTELAWEHVTPKCPLRPLHHGTTVHNHLIHCMRWKVAFRNMWLDTWGPWHGTMMEWWTRVLAADLHHVSCLRIPQSLVTVGTEVWHEAMVLVCLPLAAPIGLSTLHTPTLCGSERVLVVSMEPLDDLSCLTTPGLAVPETGCCPCC